MSKSTIGGADAIQSSKGILARVYISTLSPVRGLDLTQSNPAGAVDDWGVESSREPRVSRCIGNLEQWERCIEHHSTP